MGVLIIIIEGKSSAEISLLENITVIKEDLKAYQETIQKLNETENCKRENIDKSGVALAKCLVDQSQALIKLDRTLTSLSEKYEGIKEAMLKLMSVDILENIDKTINDLNHELNETNKNFSTIKEDKKTFIIKIDQIRKAISENILMINNARERNNMMIRGQDNFRTN